MHWELIKLRKNKNITQEEMANILKININTYSSKENGKSDFKLEEIFTIAELFNKRVEEIFLPSNIRNTDIS